MGQVADVVYVRRPVPGSVSNDPGEILMGSEESHLALIRSGVERALCSHVVVLDVAALSSFVGAARLALELVDSEDDEDEDTRVDFVAAQVVDHDGNVLFRRGAVALDGTARVLTGLDLSTEALGQHPTLLCDPRAFAVKRDVLLSGLRSGMMIPSDPAACGELAWRCWVSGGRAVTSRHVTVVGERAEVSDSPGAWKASLGRLLEDATLSRTPEGAGIRTEVSASRVAERLMRAGGLPTQDIESAMTLRAVIQCARTVPDQELFWAGLLVDSWPSDDGVSRANLRRVAVLCSDAVGNAMAGPAIRSIELARVLAATADVRIAARLSGERPEGLPCLLHELSDESVAELLRWADALVIQGPLTDWHRDVLRSDLPIAVDLYDPMNLEALESVDPDLLVPYTTNLLRDQLWRGDYFFCASERQRDFWLGMLAACGRITPGSYDEDPDLNGLIGVVPYGIPNEEPRRTGPGVRAELAGVGADDPLFVWNGGIWQWFDPDLLVLAIERLRVELPDVRALFMGVRRPGSALSEEAHRLLKLVDQHGLRDTNVFMRDWTPYAERADTYMDATAVVSLHHAHIETRFSYRTRLLDCIWSATPIICTSGDVLAPVVRDERIGITVPPGDLDAIVAALRTLATDRERVADMRARLRALASHYRWEIAAAPLVAWSQRSQSACSQRFAVTGLDPVLHSVPTLPTASLGLKALVPRPVRQHVLGPLKRRLLQTR